MCDLQSLKTAQIFLKTAVNFLKTALNFLKTALYLVHRSLKDENVLYEVPEVLEREFGVFLFQKSPTLSQKSPIFVSKYPALSK